MNCVINKARDRMLFENMKKTILIAGIKHTREQDLRFSYKDMCGRMIFSITDHEGDGYYLNESEIQHSSFER